jgi:hypothetical protein
MATMAGDTSIVLSFLFLVELSSPLVIDRQKWTVVQSSATHCQRRFTGATTYTQQEKHEIMVARVIVIRSKAIKYFLNLSNGKRLGSSRPMRERVEY